MKFYIHIFATISLFAFLYQPVFLVSATDFGEAGLFSNPFDQMRIIAQSN